MEITNELRERAAALAEPEKGSGAARVTRGVLEAVQEIYVDDAPVGPCLTWRDPMGEERIGAYLTPNGTVAVTDDHSGEEIAMDRHVAAGLVYALLALISLDAVRAHDGGDNEGSKHAA